MGRGVARVGPDRHLEGVAGLVVLALLGVEHGEVVVGLGELRVVLGQLLEDGNGFSAAVELGQDHPAQEAHLGVPGLGGEELIGLFEGLAQLTLFDEGLQVLDGVRPDRAADQAREEQGGGQSTF